MIEKNYFEIIIEKSKSFEIDIFFFKISINNSYSIYLSIITQNVYRI